VSCFGTNSKILMKKVDQKLKLGGKGSTFVFLFFFFYSRFCHLKFYGMRVLDLQFCSSIFYLSNVICHNGFTGFGLDFRAQNNKV